MDDKPSQALRHGRWKSSMWQAIEAVKKRRGRCLVSAGNTGALMAMAKILPAAPWRASSGRRSRRCGRRCAAKASCSTSARPSAPTRASWSISPSWAPPWRGCCSTSSGRPSACSMSASRRSRATRRCKRGRPHPARGAARHRSTIRLRRGRRHRQGHGRRGRHRRLRRQHRAQDRRGHGQADRRLSARRDEPHADGADRLSVRAAAPSRRCARRWIRAAPMAACSSASTASS